MPIVTVPRLLLNTLSLLILAAATILLWSWLHGHPVRLADGSLAHVHGSMWRLYTAAGLFTWSLFGRFVVLRLMPAGADEPQEEREVATIVEAPDGSALHVESFGRADAPTIILTHGWGLNATAWWYTRRALQGRFRVVTWDLPGLGRSSAPRDGRLTIDRFAQALGAVVASTGAGPVILVGHSIGGMTTQTVWRACPEAVKARVAGVVLVDTTYENPLRTMWLGPLWRALRWPLIEPICWAMIALAPLVWLSGWQSYLSGSAQLAMRLMGFGRHATRGQVDFTARLSCKGSPSIQAKGNLAMFRWSAAEFVGALPMPLLVLAGERDIVTLPEASETLVQGAPRARLIRMAGAGHMGFMERSQAYDEAIFNFADAVFAGGPRGPTPASAITLSLPR